MSVVLGSGDRLLLSLLVAALVACALLVASTAAGAQDQPDAPVAGDGPGSVDVELEPAPRGFRAIALGMEMAAVKDALSADPLFDYRGDPDISFLPTREQRLIETVGTAFIERGYFQFDADRLFVLILRLDPRRVDYFSMYSALSDKYGEPSALSPRDAIWELEQVRLSLERPVVVKYQDLGTVAAVQERAEPGTRLRDLTLRQFLEMF